MQSFDEAEGGGHDEDSKSPNTTFEIGGDGGADGMEEERQRLSDAVKCHRDRNRAPSEPAGE